MWGQGLKHKPEVEDTSLHQSVLTGLRVCSFEAPLGILKRVFSCCPRSPRSPPWSSRPRSPGSLPFGAKAPGGPSWAGCSALGTTRPSRLEGFQPSTWGSPGPPCAHFSLPGEREESSEDVRRATQGKTGPSLIPI